MISSYHIWFTGTWTHAIMQPIVLQSIICTHLTTPSVFCNLLHFLQKCQIISWLLQVIRAFIWRTKVFPQHRHERACVGLVFAVLKRAADDWIKITMSELELVQLKNLRNLICPNQQSINNISYQLAAWPLKLFTHKMDLTQGCKQKFFYALSIGEKCIT